MRNWPGIYSLFTNPNSKVKIDQIGVASLPIYRAGDDSYSCLGGWNIMLNANIDEFKLPAANKFISYLTSEAQQKNRAVKGSNLPSLKHLYDHLDILDKNPLAKNMKYMIDNSRIRPVSPNYDKISKILSSSFHKILKGEVKCEESLSQAQYALTDLFNAHQVQ